MPVVTVHPNKKWMLCQSLDNQILCYGSTGLAHMLLSHHPPAFSHNLLCVLHSDRFKLHKKKLFRGHNNAGFACGITTPPDGSQAIMRLELNFDCSIRCLCSQWWCWRTSVYLGLEELQDLQKISGSRKGAFFLLLFSSLLFSINSYFFYRLAWVLNGTQWRIAS